MGQRRKYVSGGLKGGWGFPPQRESLLIEVLWTAGWISHVRMCTLKRGSYLLSDPHSLPLGKTALSQNYKGAAVSSRSHGCCYCTGSFRPQGRTQGIFVLEERCSVLTLPVRCSSAPTHWPLQRVSIFSAESCRFQNGIFLKPQAMWCREQAGPLELDGPVS